MVRRALVTGGNRGLGYAIAGGLVARGMDVTIASRSEDAGAAAARAIGAAFLQLDLEAVSGLHEAIGEPGFDVLVNNAGVLWEHNIFADAAKVRASVETMLMAPFELIRLCQPHMTAAGYGRIVNISSGWGSLTEGLGGGGAYGIAKAALNALTVIAARDLPKTVKVNAMCPGWVKTRIGGTGAARSPEEGADTALWLATLPDDGPTGGFFRDRRPIPW